MWLRKALDQLWSKAPFFFRQSYYLISYMIEINHIFQRQSTGVNNTKTKLFSETETASACAVKAKAQGRGGVAIDNR